MVFGCLWLPRTFQTKNNNLLRFCNRKRTCSIRNIFDRDELKRSKAIATLEKYHESFRKILQIVVVLNTSYTSESNIEDISDDCITAFVNEKNFDSFSDLFLGINNTHVKNIDWKNIKDIHLVKLITFVYYSIIDFPDNKFEIKTVVTKNFFNSVNDLLFGSYVIHHSHVTGEIVGYAHDFRNKKLRETQNLIPVFTHHLFSFDFFFVMKGIRLCVWRTKQLHIGGTNLTNVQYANIGSQVKFIDTVNIINNHFPP